MESATQTATWAGLSAEDKRAALERRRDDTHGPWSLTDLLLAGLIDAVNRSDFHQLRLAGMKSARPPEPVNRPGLELTVTVRALSPAGVAYLERLRHLREGSG